MNNEAPVNYNPYMGDIAGMVTAIVKRYIAQMQTCIPAIVKKVVDRNTVIVTPAVQQINSKWEGVAWADITLPVLTPCGNGIVSSLPLTVGDTGYVIAGDLDPTLFYKSPNRPQKQQTMERHQYQYGFFVPAVVGKSEINDEGAWVISTNDGNTKVVVKEGEINITATGGDLKINADNVTITGGTNVKIDGVSFKNHTHTFNTGTITVDTQTGKNLAPLTISKPGETPPTTAA